MILKNLISFVFLVSVSLLADGAIQNKQEPIDLEADNVNYDYEKGIVNYEGQVHARQGTTDLFADKMIVNYNKKHKIEKVIAIGKLAHYSSLINDNNDVVKASAKTIFYYPIDGKVVLRDEATVEYNQNLFSGPYIFYDMKKKVISSHPKKSSQSKLVLEPIKQLKNNLK